MFIPEGVENTSGAARLSETEARSQTNSGNTSGTAGVSETEARSCNNTWLY